MRYFDASAVVKRFVREPDSAQVARWLRDGPAATSRITLVEIVSAAARRARLGRPLDFVCYDERLGAAASAEGLRVLGSA